MRARKDLRSQVSFISSGDCLKLFHYKLGVKCNVGAGYKTFYVTKFYSLTSFIASSKFKYLGFLWPFHCHATLRSLRDRDRTRTGQEPLLPKAGPLDH